MQSQNIPNLLIDSTKNDEPTLIKLSDALASFKSEAVTNTSELVAGEVDKLKNFQNKIDEILTHISRSKQKCLETINNLGNEEKDLGRQVEEYKREQKVNDVEGRLREEIKSLEKEYVTICKNRIKTANSLDIKKLDKVEIEDRKSIANEVFKWVLVAIYTEPQSKFYWPNFKKEAFEKDKGKDFMERLGKITSMETKEEQRLKTEHFIQNFDEIAKSPQLKTIKQDVNKIRDVAEAFRQGYKISAEIANCHTRIEKHMEQMLEKDQENLRSQARISALEGRIEVNKNFLRVLELTEEKLGSKKDTYEEKISNGEGAIGDLEKLNQWTPKISLQADPNQNCEGCRLF